MDDNINDNDEVMPDAKKELLDSLFSIFKNQLVRNQWEPIETKSFVSASNVDTRQLLKQFAIVLCMSCNTNNLEFFNSIKYFLETRNLDEIREIQIYFTQYNELSRMYGNALSKVRLEHKSLEDKFQNDIFLLQQTIKEQENLEDINFPQINKKYKGFSKTRSVAEKTNQLVISDLIYLIDYLNRSIKK